MNKELSTKEKKLTRKNSIEEFDDKVVVQENSNLPVYVSSETASEVSDTIVSHKYYNSFNFSKLSTQFGHLNLAIGITSANKQEGKTLVASNMAVSIARGYQRRTLLVDMNFENPQLHKIFGVDVEPGLAEAIEFKNLRVFPTTIKNLYVMPVGDIEAFKPGIEHTLVLRDILNSLKSEFDFVIIDMGSILPIKNFLSILLMKSTA